MPLESASTVRLHLAPWFASLLVLFGSTLTVRADSARRIERYREEVQPLLSDYCFGCHADGAEEGGVAFDRLASDEELLADRDLWWTVLKNVRANIMPPYGEASPEPHERLLLTDWIKRDVFGIDPIDPDPGRNVVRRLNRTEYRNTIRDLTGVDFDAEVVFPQDDTGFGFDTIADVLTLSPMLLEKYFDAAESIIEEAVPKVTRAMARRELTGKDFLLGEGSGTGAQMSCYRPARVSHTVAIEDAGQYWLNLEVRIRGSLDFDPGRCEVAFLSDGEELYREEYAWQERTTLVYQFPRNWDPGEHELAFELTPLVEPRKEPALDFFFRRTETFVHFQILSVRVEGPADPAKWTHPQGYERFFTRDAPPETAEARREYAGELLRGFATKAYRRPPSDTTVDRLVAVAEAVYKQPAKSFEEGIGQAMAAVLASPRFLFRIEPVDAARRGEMYPYVDEYALASRLSYFLWSTMPDDELFDMAARGQLRANLSAQVARMLADPRSDALIRNFAGQWLRARDVERASIDSLSVLGLREEWEQLRADFLSRRRRSRDAGPIPVPERFHELRAVLLNTLSGDVRRAMRRETEMALEFVVRENRSVVELLDSDYVFANSSLAKHYGIPDIKGSEMRRVELPEGSPYGGVLTQGTMLIVTSNPTRTSPVKRGLFILDNILGTPAPPAPGNVPELEEAAKELEGREPTLREVLEFHREAPICASCHARMDPLGIALENFNALAQWRDTYNGQPIDASGELITGEAFDDIQDLKKIIATEHRIDFYRCLTQKLMTYALGRGLDYYDEMAIDQIVDELARNDGRFLVLLNGIVQSAQFQKQRNPAAFVEVSIESQDPE